MHELSLIANLFDIMEEKAEEKNARRITFVKLQVGLHAGAVPELLQSAFDIYKKDTIASNAELNIEVIPLRFHCRSCGHTMEAEDLVFSCVECGSNQLETIAGTDMILQKMELEVDE
jgi:hydrogenase nickel incorporation protein HypA/HybF